MSDHTGDKVVYVDRDGASCMITLQQDDFTIDPSHIDSELCNMGWIMLQYGEVETELQLEVDRKKAQLEKLKADLYISIRETASKDGIKMTENQLASKVASAATKGALEEEIATSRQNHALIRWAMTALQAKRDCLISLSYRERQLMKADHY